STESCIIVNLKTTKNGVDFSTPKKSNFLGSLHTPLKNKLAVF
ncbi:hypothetical protein M2139_002341, partial [Enterococcus sp. PF1-24]|nr:hypothetical protein [Enterococcus sp. PFB1-1]MDH6402440.1 hypothetical protein [Enterococcus sp. PF1-24]